VVALKYHSNSSKVTCVAAVAAELYALECSGNSSSGSDSSISPCTVKPMHSGALRSRVLLTRTADHSRRNSNFQKLRAKRHCGCMLQRRQYFSRCKNSDSSSSSSDKTPTLSKQYCCYCKSMYTVHSCTLYESVLRFSTEQLCLLF
jgi:hypothetical protein